MASAAILDIIEPEIAPFDPLTLKTLAQNQTWNGADAKLGYSEIFAFKLYCDV